jgi:hypothetical protein
MWRPETWTPGDSRRSDERGAALLVAILAMVMLAAVGGALILATSTDGLIAGSFQAAAAAQYAAEAAAERAVLDLTRASDWDGVLSGASPAPYADGLPVGTRSLPDGTSLDLGQVVSVATCGKLTTCSLTDAQRVTLERPWGVNNPIWRVWAFGPVRMVTDGLVEQPEYVVVLVADDPSEIDGNPSTDGRVEEGSPGAGVLLLRVEAFGLRGVRRAVALTVARTPIEGQFPPFPLRVVAWHPVQS